MKGGDDNLVRMANRIGDFFEALPDRSEGVAGVANHIRLFWEPRMRWQLLAILDAQVAGTLPADALALSALVRDAVVQHRDTLTPARATAREGAMPTPVAPH